MKPTIGNPAPGNAQRHRPANSLGQAGGPLLGGALFIWQINAPYLFSGLRFQKLKEEKKMSCCSDVMKPIEAPSCCTSQDTAAHAARVVRDSGCGCAPVVEDTENLKLVGVVTEREVCCGGTVSSHSLERS